MKRLLENLRSRSPEVRLSVAAVLALCTTALIAAGWVMVPSGGQPSTVQAEKAPGPFSALLDSVTGIIQTSPLGKQTDQPVEIIDAGESDEQAPPQQQPSYDLYDETNPYQAQ